METRGPGEPDLGPDSAENSGCQPSSLPLALLVEGAFCTPQRTVLGRERLQVMKIYRDLVGTRATLLPHDGPVSPVGRLGAVVGTGVGWEGLLKCLGTECGHNTLTSQNCVKNADYLVSKDSQTW